MVSEALQMAARDLECGEKGLLAHASTSSSTRELTHRMSKGDENAYRQFFEDYFRRLFGYLLVLTSGREELARELLQRTMIKVARHVRTFQTAEEFWRWLTVLARTCAFDEQRKTRRYFAFLDRFWLAREDHRIEPSNRQSISEVLEEKLGSLQPEERSLLEKKYLQGHSVREIAADLALTEKAVESRLTRARLRLKELMLKSLSNPLN